MRAAAGRHSQPPFGSAVRFILHYLRGWRVAFSGLLLLVVLAAGCAVAVQYVMKILVDAMAGPRDGSLAWQALAGFIGLIAIESVLWRVTGWLGCRTTVSIGVAVRLDLFRHLGAHPMRYFSDNLAGSLGHRLTATAGHFGGLVSTFVWRIIPPCIDFIGALIIFATVDMTMMAALAVAVAVLMGGLLAFGGRGRHLHLRYARKASDTSGDLTDVISNMWSVKAFSARLREHDRLRAVFEREAGAQRASWMYTEKARFIHDIALWLLAGGMLFWAVSLWSAGRITPGEVVVVSTMTFRILHGSRDLALSVVEMVQQFGFIEETLRVIGSPPGVADAPDAVPLPIEKGAIEFENVAFGYRDDSEAIHDFNLVIPAGQKVGIVGPSGAGKSTIVHLLQRLSDVRKGEIRIDGKPLTALQQDSLREALAVVPQEIALFHRSIADNIRFARPQASDAEVEAAARAAQCEGFIRRLPEGYDTLVGERGAKLSGGQRQRIGIARAILKNAPIVILDEATSALDTETELKIQQALVSLMAERTVISVAHRLSTLASFDRILVIADGRIVEDAPPALLRATPGLFNRMWRLQAEGLEVA